MSGSWLLETLDVDVDSDFIVAALDMSRARLAWVTCSDCLKVTAFMLRSRNTVLGALYRHDFYVRFSGGRAVVQCPPCREAEAERMRALWGGRGWFLFT